LNSGRLHIQELYGHANWSQAVINDALRLITGDKAEKNQGAAAPLPFSIAFAGGKTPVPLYQQLAQVLAGYNAARNPAGAALPPILGFAGDERHTPGQPQWRNGQMLRDAFAMLLEKQQLQLLDWPDSASATTACSEMAEKLGTLATKHTDSGFGLDLCYLGLGADGHTAGIFGQPLLVAANGLCALYQAPDHPHQRLSLTPDALLSAKSLRLLVQKSGKETALADLTAETPKTTAGKLLQRYLAGNPAADCIVFLSA